MPQHTAAGRDGVIAVSTQPNTKRKKALDDRWKRVGNSERAFAYHCKAGVHDEHQGGTEDQI